MADQSALRDYTSTLAPLQAGERLTRAEFERRYHAMPHLKRAELLNGVVVMPSPVRAAQHGIPHMRLITWLGVYQAATPGVDAADNSTLRLPNEENEPQPDAMLFLLRDGAAWIGADGYVEGAPELVAEVAASSVVEDTRTKRAIYQQSGIQEYLVWQVEGGQLDWWELREGEYVALPRNEKGIISSRVFPGLWLDVPALLAGNLAQVLATLQQGIDRSEHTAFVARLAGGA